MVGIRRCREDDFPAIARLLRQLWPSASISDDLLRSAFLRGLNNDTNSFICADENDQVIGFCSVILKNSLWQQGWLAHVDELVVDESARGRGVGTRLLEAAIQIAAAKGAASIELDSGFHRTEAHKFYQQRGFENRAYLFSKKLSPQPTAPHQLSRETNS